MSNARQGGMYVIQDGKRVLVERTNWEPPADEVVAIQTSTPTAEDDENVFPEEILTGQD